ncbi:MAG: hypothetical protein IV090_16845 [Candidatus Sericytochromatia bacterium]|nr:hypothetical protein [Candidatus Sericytochromatia bacterium]
MKKVLILSLVLSITSCSSPPTQTSSSQILKDLSKTLNEYIEQQKRQPSSAPTIQPSAKPSPTPLPTPTAIPTPTAAPIVLTTPVPTPTFNPYNKPPESTQPVPDPIPTPSPLPIILSTPTPTPTTIVFPTIPPTTQTLIPSGFRVPTGINKCRVFFGMKTSSGSNLILLDWQSTVEFIKLDAYWNLFYSSEYPKLGIGIPSLEPGTYLGSSNLAREDKSYLAVRWSSTNWEWSTDSVGQSEVTVLGNQNGYIWGKFKGVVGMSTSSYTIVTGEFACVP